MKRQLLNLLPILSAMFLTALPTMAGRDFAYDYKGKTLTYTVIDEDAKTCEVKRGDYDSYRHCYIAGNNAKGELVIPAVVSDGVTEYSVTEIGLYAFYQCNGLASVTVPGSVTYIGNSAFKGCDGLRNLRLEDGDATLSLSSNSMNTIGSIPGLFSQCPLENVYIGRNLYYSTLSSQGVSPFYNNKNLKNLTIGDSVTHIGKQAFRGCSGLTSLTVGNSLKNVYDWAFYGCDALSVVNISDIGAWLGIDFENEFANPLFWADKLLLNGEEITSVEIPESVTSVSAAALKGCDCLISITIPNSVTSIGSYAFSGCESLVSVTIPNTVTSIGHFAFASCKSIESVSIPASVKSVGIGAFRLCDQLKNLRIEDGEEALILGDFENESYGIFYNTPLETVYVGRTLLRNSISPFYEHQEIKSLTIGNLVTEIGKYEYYNCSGLDTVSIGSSVSEIGSSAFEGCRNLKSISIPGSVNSIDNYAFNECYSLANLRFEDSPNTLHLGYAFTNADNQSGPYRGYGLFHYCSLRSIYLGRNLSYDSSYLYGFSPFIGPSNHIYDVTIGGYVTEIGDNAFIGCSMSELTIPENVTKIGKSAFKGWQKLTKLVIPASVRSIGNEAFAGCTSLSEVRIEDGYGYLYTYVNIFGECPLRDVYVGKNVTYENSKDNLNSPFFEKTTIKSVEFGNLMFKIETEMFKGCSALVSVTFGKGCDEIGNSAFGGCPVERLVSHSYKIENIQNSGLDMDIPVILDTESDFRGISDTNFTCFSNLTLKERNMCYGLIKSKYDLKFDKCHFKEGEFYVMPFEECHAFHDNPGVKVLARGEDITYRACSEEGYLFTPSTCFRDNVFDFYGIPESAELSREIRVPSPGKLFDELGMQNIDKVEVLKLVGDINGTDVMTINRMSSLRYLDLSATNIVEGGVTYRDDLKTENGVVGRHFLKDIPLEVLHLPKSARIIADAAFFEMKNLKHVFIYDGLTSIGVSSFGICESLESVKIPDSVTSIGAHAFSCCFGLKGLSIGKSVRTIGESAFIFCSVEEVLLPASVEKIGAGAFGYNPGLAKVVSLNPTPPEIDADTFDEEVKAHVALHVRKGALVNYWLDPVWKEFLNMSEDVMCFLPIPDAGYGDDEIDLSLYAPEGVDFKYETSNDEVVEINGTVMRIVGAGTATIASLQPDDGTSMELIGQIRQFKVAPADLNVTVEDVVIARGRPLPEFVYVVEGLKYDDTINDIENLPQPVCDVNEFSPVGVYEVSFVGGSDHNYRFLTAPAKVTVTDGASTDEIPSSDEYQEVTVYAPDGMIVYKGVKENLLLDKGIYIMREGKNLRKFVVK